MTTTTMASSTAFQQTDIELPRYRGDAKQAQVQDDVKQVVQRYNSFSSSVASVPTHYDRDSSTQVAEAVTQRTVVITLTFRRTLFKSDITVHSGALATPVYHAATTEWNFFKPDITLYAGGDTTGPIIAVSHFRWSPHAKLGIGDPTNEHAVVWEDFVNPTPYWSHARYDFSFSIQTGSSLPSTTTYAARWKLAWQRIEAASYGENSWSSWLSRRHYELIDVDTGDILAVFLADNFKSLKQIGELRLFRHVSKELEVMIVLTMATISEKATRRIRKQQKRVH